MKLATEQQLKEHRYATYRGAMEGGIASSIVGGAGLWWAHSRYPKFRALPPTLKTLAFILVVAPVLTIQAERRGLEYEQNQWVGQTADMLRQKAVHEENHWNTLTTSQKAQRWFLDHQYTTITGAWALSLAASGALISRQKGSTPGQKLVQARMYAQAFTIALLIGAGVISARERLTNPPDRRDHSWVHVLEEREHNRQATSSDVA